jgi:hypothetical protein
MSSAAETKRVAFIVICENQIVAQKISDEIRGEIGKHPNFEINSKYPAATLFVYAQQDVNDRKNPNGWSFAIAHASNTKSQYLVLKLIDSKSKDVERVKPVLLDTLEEQGFLHHLNVAHMDEMSDQSLEEVITVVVDNFITKVSN